MEKHANVEPYFVTSLIVVLQNLLSASWFRCFGSRRRTIAGISADTKRRYSLVLLMTISDT